MKPALLIICSSFGVGLISLYILIRKLRTRVIRRQLWKQIMKGGDHPNLSSSDGGFINFWKKIWYMLLINLLGLKWCMVDFFSTHRKWELNGIRKRPGDVCVITGGARGIGAEIVKKLLQCEMHVIIGCRKISAGNLLVSQIRESGLHSGTTEILNLDLMSLESVRHFASEILSKNCPIHILINNAGIMFVPYEQTMDGFESHFQVNYLSHFLLTNLLVPRIATTSTNLTHPQTRIINVSSIAHYGGHVDFDDLQMQNFYSPHLAYMTSKLLQVISTKYMDDRFKKQGIKGVRVHSVHPGIVQTDLYEHLWWVNAFQFIVKLFFKTPEQGADGIVYAALSSDIDHDGGLYLANCMKWKPNPKVFDTLLQENLWNVSNKLLGQEDLNSNVPLLLTKEL